MLPVNRVIASATRACSVASASSRSRRAVRVAIFLSRTELRPGGFGEGLVGDPRPAERPLAVPFPTGDMFASLALKPDPNEPELSQLGSACRTEGARLQSASVWDRSFGPEGLHTLSSNLSLPLAPELSRSC